MSIPLPLSPQARGVVSALFIGRLDTPDPTLDRLIQEFSRAGGHVSSLVTAQQVHSARVLEVEGTPSSGPLGEGDALVTRTPGILLGVRTADCLPLLAIDPAVPVLAVVHAGWRGTAAGVLGRAVDVMVSKHGARAGRIEIAAGPGAGPCCYEVGTEVTRAFPPEALVRQGSGAVHLDLVEANRLQAVEAGVDPGRFVAGARCSICNPGQCHSYRRDGSAAGRMWLMASLRPAGEA